MIALFVALLFFATPSRAIAGASILEPAPPRTNESGTGLHFGMWVSSSQPIFNAQDLYARSAAGGLALTWMQGRSTGVGVAVDYARWRAPATGAALDDLFSRLSGTEIRGTEITMSGLRASVRFTQWVASDAATAPWFQAGAGLCRLNRKLILPVDQLIASGWQVDARGAIDISYQPFIVGGVGFDVATSSTVKVGFDVMGEFILLLGKENENEEPITTLRIGGHVQFGRWAGR